MVYPCFLWSNKIHLEGLEKKKLIDFWLVLMSLILFEEYPLDSFSLFATMLNPIDLSRTLILLKLDISALLGYTGAVFKSFFGTKLGYMVSMALLLTWVILPIWRLVSIAKKKDF
ncbi:MAG: Cu-processing system permease protein [Psychroserpens sp.]|jgi:Cu-processing system permease protein